jgi:hypothetical protein
MKKRAFIILLLLLVVGLWVLWHRSQPAGEPTAQSITGETNQPIQPAARGRRVHTTAAPATAPSSAPNPSAQNNAALIESRLKEIKAEMQKGLDEWRTPIEFYGKVVDERTNPVQAAQINFDCNDLSPKGTSFYHTQSDADGLFSIRDISGKLLGVKVSKDGYYSYEPFGADFYYAGQNQNFVPDASNPVIFRLKKKGVAEPLVHVHAAMGGGKGFRIARDGNPLELSLTTGNVAPLGQGDVRVECQTDDQGKPPGQKYDWKCQIIVPNGGILQSTNDLDFQAPTDGYRLSDVIEMPASLESSWSSRAKRNYFLKLANGNYARMSFEMIAGGDHFFQLESFLNPSGSRNLEFDPSNAISVSN